MLTDGLELGCTIVLSSDLESDRAQITGNAGKVEGTNAINFFLTHFFGIQEF